MISVYNKLSETDLNMRKREILDQYIKLIQWGRANPVHFIKEIFNIELMDYQKFVFLNSWAAQKSVWLNSRNTGKSFLSSLYAYTRACLVPLSLEYIMGPTARQSKETFDKLEKIVTKKIPSLLGTSEMLAREVIPSGPSKSGFIQNAMECHCELYNGSMIYSLVGEGKNIVGKINCPIAA